jgi:hypothetical protein
MSWQFEIRWINEWIIWWIKWIIINFVFVGTSAPLHPSCSTTLTSLARVKLPHAICSTLGWNMSKRSCWSTLDKKLQKPISQRRLCGSAWKQHNIPVFLPRVGGELCRHGVPHLICSILGWNMSKHSCWSTFDKLSQKPLSRRRLCGSARKRHNMPIMVKHVGGELCRHEVPRLICSILGWNMSKRSCWSTLDKNSITGQKVSKNCRSLRHWMGYPLQCSSVGNSYCAPYIDRYFACSSQADGSTTDHCSTYHIQRQ